MNTLDSPEFPVRTRTVPLTGLVLLLVVASAVASSPVLACSGKHADWVRYAGTRDQHKLLAEPVVAAQLRRLPAPVRRHLMRNLAVAGTIDLVSCDLVIAGNAEHMGGAENAIVDVNLYSGTLSAAILGRGHIDIYADIAGMPAGMEYDVVPLSIKDWVGVAAEGFRTRMQPARDARVVPLR